MLCLICLVFYYHPFLFLFRYHFSLSSVNFISCIFVNLSLLFCTLLSFMYIYFFVVITQILEYKTFMHIYLFVVYFNAQILECTKDLCFILLR